MQPPSDHLLRTLAAVPVSSHILDLGCGEGRHTEPLLRLGFPVHACDPRLAAVRKTREAILNLVGEETVEQCVRPAALDAMDAYPDAAFDWVIAYHAEVWAQTADELATLMSEAARLLKPGGWVYVTVPASMQELERAEAASGDGARAEGELESLFSVDMLERTRADAELAVASEPEVVQEMGKTRIRAIYRRPHR